MNLEMLSHSMAYKKKRPKEATTNTAKRSQPMCAAYFFLQRKHLLVILWEKIKPLKSPGPWYMWYQWVPCISRASVLLQLQWYKWTLLQFLHQYKYLAKCEIPPEAPHQSSTNLTTLICWYHSLTHCSNQHAQDGQKSGDFSTKEVTQNAEHKTTKGPCQKGGGKAQPSCDGRSMKEVALEVWLQESKNCKLIPLQDVSQQERPIDLQNIPNISTSSHGVKWTVIRWLDIQNWKTCTGGYTFFLHALSFSPWICCAYVKFESVIMSLRRSWKLEECIMSSCPVLLALGNRKCDKWSQNNTRALAFQQVL